MTMKITMTTTTETADTDVDRLGNEVGEFPI